MLRGTLKMCEWLSGAICNNTGVGVGSKNCLDCVVTSCVGYKAAIEEEKESLLPRGKITKLPNNIDPNLMIKKKMEEKYSVCPFCGESKKGLIITESGEEGISCHTRSWYGKKKDTLFSFLKLWEENHHWRIDSYYCRTCGAGWESEPYPTDIKVEL